MKALTVHQPWAWAIIHGLKRIENRTWRTRYRGPLLIHAGKSQARLLANRRLIDGTLHPPPKQLVFGAVLGQVQLVGCVPVEECPGNPFAEGPWCWLLDQPLPFAEPVIRLGAQNLWQFPDELLPASLVRPCVSPEPIAKPALVL